MEVSGSYEFNAPAATVWSLLLDPEVLASCVPGVESLETVGDDQYQAVLSLGIGPVRGRYNAKITLRDQDPYHSYRLVVEGSGLLGFANGESEITLVEDNGKTTLQVKGDAQIGGRIARVGQRMMGSVAKGMLDQFIKCTQESLNSRRL